MGATVIPIRPGVVEPAATAPVIRRPATTPCPVCGLPACVKNYDGDRTCDCGAAMHDPCYWGRVASLSEWRAYFGMLDGDDENPPWPPTVCGACRAKEGS